MAYSPIISPYFSQVEDWPYFKGPNYTRPVFAEHDRGSFVTTPIIRMPSLSGLAGGEHRGGGGGHHGGGFRRPGGYGGNYGYSLAPSWHDAPYGGFLKTAVGNCGPGCTWNGYTCFCPKGFATPAAGLGCTTGQPSCLDLLGRMQGVIDCHGMGEDQPVPQDTLQVECQSGFTWDAATKACVKAAAKWYTNPLYVGAAALAAIVAGLSARALFARGPGGYTDQEESR